MKRIISVAVAVLGVVMVVYAISGMKRIADAKGNVSMINRSISGSSGGRMLGDKLSSEASQYDTKVRILLIAGLLFTAGGCFGVYHYRHHRR